MMRYLTSMCLLALTATSCSFMPHRHYCVGIDPSFYELDVPGQSANIYLFICDVLGEIGKSQYVSLHPTVVSWNQLHDTMDTGICQAVISALPPSVTTHKTYSFSHVLLPTGPVLVVQIDRPFDNLYEMSGQNLALQQLDAQLEYLVDFPEVEKEFYIEIGPTLEALTNNQYAGALIPQLFARPYIRNLYADTLMITDQPFNDEGLRLITKRDQHTELPSIINAGLKKLHKSGRWQKLLNKWQL